MEGSEVLHERGGGDIGRSHRGVGLQLTQFNCGSLTSKNSSLKRVGHDLAIRGALVDPKKEINY